MADVASIRGTYTAALFLDEHFSQLLQLLANDFIERSVNHEIFHLVLETFDFHGASGR
ncbi:hypothetical protein D3C80_2229320 [compost metagenome]